MSGLLSLTAVSRSKSSRTNHAAADDVGRRERRGIGLEQRLRAPLALQRVTLLQSLLNGLRGAVDHQKISASRPFRLSRALFPMAQRVDAEPESSGNSSCVMSSFVRIAFTSIRSGTWTRKAFASVLPSA
ncbi:hypothetical protein T190_20350 [Sinorhizobium meliloti CCBAU 01290]|nr:hypothetical protein T190_20350 [Sinorhizobium meliloti CCBAU 01290]